jgi:hypothetical protein
MRSSQCLHRQSSTVSRLLATVLRRPGIKTPAYYKIAAGKM